MRGAALRLKSWRLWRSGERAVQDPVPWAKMQGLRETVSVGSSHEHVEIVRRRHAQVGGESWCRCLLVSFGGGVMHVVSSLLTSAHLRMQVEERNLVDCVSTFI